MAWATAIVRFTESDGLWLVALLKMSLTARSVSLIAILTGCVLLPAESVRPPAGPEQVSAWRGIHTNSPVVLLFHSVECPLSDRYVPTIKRLEETFRAAGVRFYLIFPNQNEGHANVADYLAERGLTLPRLRDRDGALSRAVGATVTPEAVVLLPGGSATAPQVVYRGRYDDRYTALGQARPRATVQFLHDVLTLIAAGGRPTFVDTGAVGCYIVAENASAEARAPEPHHSE